MHSPHSHSLLEVSNWIRDLQRAARERGVVVSVTADQVRRSALTADTNLLKVPDTDPDEKWLFLSDILPTAWWANECANVQQGDTVAIWGSGPGTH